ncbi:hypothetical protein [Aureimonas sp. AU20]|uniref:hypothetical protein n=1 Tax=Aureimonas sp. AU20 TaxID=1349819 RepID=UPI00071F751F|nr:hypothetical protein [Aureimonas sp. AU20]ALN71634.1 hypothetical protein M673_02850 [Aureimonas sp. AU20]
MANRPRRSKPGARPETTIDLEAERIAKTGGAESGADMGSASEAEQDETVSMNDKTKQGDPSQTPEERHEEALLSATADSAAERERKNEIATGSASADALAGAEPASVADPLTAAPARPDAGEPLTASEPVSASSSEPVFSAASEPATSSEGALLGETAKSDETAKHEDAATDDAVAGEPVAEPAAEFAREEGFAGKKRDLGEFEDDETVLPAAHPEPAGPDPLTSSPYHAAAGTTHGDGRGPGFGPLLGAGLLGAAIALGGGAALLYSGVVSPPAAQVQPAQTQQFATAGEVQKLTGDISTLRGTVEQLQSAQAAGGAGSGNVSRTEFTQLSDRVAANERYAQTNGDSAAAAAQANDAANAARETATRAETAANEARDTAGRAETAATSAQSAAQNAQQAAQNAQTAANDTREAVNGFGSRVQSIEESNRRAAIALSAAGLKGAIDSGRPFMQELESFAGASGNGGESVASLRNFAASGVPTVSALAAEWNEAETRILAALRPVDSTADVGTQVLSGLRSLVTVRPAGSSVGTDAPGPESAVARMDKAIEGGDFAAWLKEWDTLPEAAKSASQTFADKVRARANADDLIRQTINSAVGASASQG